jgi:SAM-dependent methyltransferase
MAPTDPYYRGDLALVHHRGFGFHADACAPGILSLLEPVRERAGLILELGCGSGLLTRKLVDAGHRVIATDASPAMLEVAKEHADGAEDIRQLTLPDDPLPKADAIVSIGHAVSYLPDEEAVDRALIAIARAVRPGGLFAVDICDLEWGRAREGLRDSGRVGEDWAIVTRYSMPTPQRFVREMTTFLRNPDGSWRRDDERLDNVLVDTGRIPARVAPEGIEATVTSSFGQESNPDGLRVVIGRRPA